MPTAGTYTAWQQLKPLEGDVATDLQNQEKLDLEKQQQDREDARFTADEKEKAAKAAKEKRKEREDDLNALDVKATGFSSHDDPIIDLYSRPGGLKDQYNSVMDALEKNPDDRDALMKLHNMKKSVETLNQFRAPIMDNATALGKGLADGTYSETLNKKTKDDYNALMKAQYTYQFDDKGIIGVKRVGSAPYDPDGDGIPNDFSVQDVNDASRFANFRQRFDVKKDMDQAKVDFGTKETVTDGAGYTTTTIKGFDQKKKPLLTKSIDDKFGPSLDKMTDAFKSYLGDTLKTDPASVKTDADFQDIKKHYVDNVIAQYDEVQKNEKNYTAENAADDNAIKRSELSLKKKIAAGKINKDEVSIGEGVTPTEQTYGTINMTKIDTNTTRSIPVQGQVIIPALSARVSVKTGNKYHVVKTNFTNFNVQNYTYNKDGKLVLNGFHEVTKNNTTKTSIDTTDDPDAESAIKTTETTKTGLENKKATVTVSSENEALVAKGLKMSVDQMRNSVKVQKGASSNPAPVKTTIMRSDIATKAKAAGYTAQEYEKLLIGKGIQIK